MFKDKKSFKILSIAIIVIIAVWVSGIVIYQSKLIQEQPGPTTIVIEDKTAYWNVYRNEDYGFRIKYPEDWDLVETTEIEGFENTLKTVIEFNPTGMKSYVEGELIKPLSIKVIKANMEQYNKYYPDFSILGESSEEPLARLMVIRNLEEDELIFLFIDKGGVLGEEIKTTTQKIISTFKFLD